MSWIISKCLYQILKIDIQAAQIERLRWRLRDISTMGRCLYGNFVRSRISASCCASGAELERRRLELGSTVTLRVTVAGQALLRPRRPATFCNARALRNSSSLLPTSDVVVFSRIGPILVDRLQRKTRALRRGETGSLSDESRSPSASLT